MPTPFQKRVYAALEQVPHGRVITYKQLAECLGCRSYRAVGQALKHNPYAPQVPCHRVIASDLTPGGFMGRRGGTAMRRKAGRAQPDFFVRGQCAEIIPEYVKGPCFQE